jgi:hypothetical protein
LKNYSNKGVLKPNGLECRNLGVSPQSAANWIDAQAASLPETPQPAENETVELDELFTFMGRKKTKPTS